LGLNANHYYQAGFGVHENEEIWSTEAGVMILHIYIPATISRARTMLQGKTAQLIAHKLLWPRQEEELAPL
jgi:hypothetical protein